VTQLSTTHDAHWPARAVCKAGKKERRRQQQRNYQIIKRVGAKLPSVISKGIGIDEERYSYTNQRAANGQEKHSVPTARRQIKPKSSHSKTYFRQCVVDLNGSWPSQNTNEG
jgi:hypothetical protein